VKQGNLVKRKESEWTKYNKWLVFDNANEVGIVVRIENNVCQVSSENYVVVLWPVTGLSWDDPEDLELVNESR